MKTKLIFLILIGILSQACSNTAMKSSRATNTANSRTSNGIVGSGGSSQVVQSACSGDAYGWIYDHGDGMFQKHIEDFVSVSLAPGNLGVVDTSYGASNSVQVQIQAQFTNQGQFLNQDTFLQILINDSRVGEVDVTTGNAIEPYEVYLSQANSGSYNSVNGEYAIEFADDYGKVNIIGQIQGEDFVGRISFVNHVAYDGGTGRAGILGAIRVPKCSIVVL